MPTIHSKTAISANSRSKYCMPIVLVVSASARGLAGLSPSNLISPNQKNIRNIEKRAKGINVLRKNAISRRSNCVILVLCLSIKSNHNSFYVAVPIKQGYNCRLLFIV